MFTHTSSGEAIAAEDESIVLAGFSSGYTGVCFSTDSPDGWTWVPGFYQDGDQDFSAVKLNADGVEEWRWQVRQ